MPFPWSPYDRAVGNDRLGLLQLIAKNQRYVDPAVRGRWPEESLEPPSEAISPMMPRSRSPVELLRRQRTPVAQRPAGAPTEAAQPAPATGGFLGTLNNLTPAERARLRSSMLGGAAAGVSNLLAGRPQAGVGEILLAAGAGGLTGREAGQRGIELGQARQAQADLAQQNLTLAQQKAQREAEAQRALQQVIEDPSTPPEMKRALQVAAAGAPASAVTAMLPERMSPYQQESIEERRAYNKARLGQYERALDIQEARAAEGRGPNLTALQQNVPFVAKALKISEGDATKLLLTPAGGRKSREEVITGLAQTYARQNFNVEPEEAVFWAEDVYDRIHGQGEGAAVPTGPGMDVTAEASEREGFSGSALNPLNWFGGEEEEAPAAEAASPEGLPPNADVAIGQIVRAPNGQLYRKVGPDEYEPAG